MMAAVPGFVTGVTRWSDCAADQAVRQDALTCTNVPFAKCLQVLSGGVLDAMSTIKHFTPRRSRGMMARLSRQPPSANFMVWCSGTPEVCTGDGDGARGGCF